MGAAYSPPEARLFVKSGFRDGEAAVILDAAAAAVVARGVGVGAVVGHDDLVEVQGSARVDENAAPVGGDFLAIGDRQAADGHVWPAAISKTRLESLPLTDSLFAPGPLIVTLSVISNSLCQRDGAVQPLREGDGSVAGLDARPQRVGAAVVQVGHREGAEQPPVLHHFQPRQDRAPREAAS